MTGRRYAAQTEDAGLRSRVWNRRSTRKTRLRPRSFPISTVIGNRATEIARYAGYAAFAAVAALSLAGCRQKPVLTAQQAQGKQLYEVRCAHCHEYNDLALKKVPPDLHSVFARPRLPSGAPATDVQVAQTVLAGKGMMPSFAGRFTTAQMEALLAYMHTTEFAEESRP